MKNRSMCAVALFLLIVGFVPATGSAKQFKVLAVMSYGENFPWAAQIKDGIGSALGYACDIRYFYMNTKKNFEGGPAKAEEAFKLYREFQPDGVIAADDNAQSMFVVPYLKGKVNTPVMFCGVNAEPEKYGYPASHISGILERPHFAESIAFLKQLVPSAKTFGYLFVNNSTGKAFAEQIEKESQGYSLKLTGSGLVNTFKEAMDEAGKLSAKCDALCMISFQGLTDDEGKPINEGRQMPLIIKAFGKPTFGDTTYGMKYGLLCAITKTGQEQGKVAAEMLLKAMKGTPVPEIPVTVNHKGRPVVNVTAVRELGIRPSSTLLQQAELVKTEK